MTMSMTIMTVYTLYRLHNFIHRLVISSLSKRLEVSILPNVYFIWCTVRRSPHSLSQHFPAHKTSTLRFHHCGLYHPTKAPSCAKVRITPRNWETTCYLTKPTHISPVLCVVHMVTRSTNRTLGSLAGTTTIQNST
jgi:hypothetical protein